MTYSLAQHEVTAFKNNIDMEVITKNRRCFLAASFVCIQATGIGGLGVELDTVLTSGSKPGRVVDSND